MRVGRNSGNGEEIYLASRLLIGFAIPTTGSSGSNLFLCNETSEKELKDDIVFALASRLKRSLKPNKDWRSLKIIEFSFKGAWDAGATGAALDAGATGAIEGTSILSLDERSSVTSVVTSRLKDGNWNGCRLKIYIPGLHHAFQPPTSWPLWHLRAVQYIGIDLAQPFPGRHPTAWARDKL